MPLGIGAFTSCGEWLQLKWPEVWRDIHITVKELLPVVMVVAIWGHKWKGKSVKYQCDNATVVAIINTTSEKAMYLMQTAFFLLTYHDIRVWVQHLPGAENRSTDAFPPK